MMMRKLRVSEMICIQAYYHESCNKGKTGTNYSSGQSNE